MGGSRMSSARHVRVRGYDKVLAHLMLTVLTASQLMRLSSADLVRLVSFAITAPQESAKRA